MFSNRTGRYLKYALGEIILIILGIFLALQLQNWNEKRKRTKNFRDGIEKIYNGLTIDIANIETNRRYFLSQLDRIDRLLFYPDSIPNQAKMKALAFIATANFNSFKSETAFYLDKLDAEENNLEQIELQRQIVRYKKDLDKNGIFCNNIPDNY